MCNSGGMRHPDEIRADLRQEGARIAELRRERDAAYRRVAELAAEGLEFGVPLAEAARLSGVSRTVLYAHGLKSRPNA